MHTVYKISLGELDYHFLDTESARKFADAHNKFLIECIKVDTNELERIFAK